MPIAQGTVLDIFAGGCSVSYGLKDAGYSVFANDILFADYVIAKALVENNSTQIGRSLIDKTISKENKERALKKVEFLSNSLYFDYEIDELAELVAISNTLKSYEKYMFLALLRRAMIRKLPYSRMNIEWEQIKKLRDENYSYQKYGRRRAYHNQSFRAHMLENIDEYNSAVFKSRPCKVFNSDALTIARKTEKVDVVYMDPPYPSTLNDYDSFYGQFDQIFGKKKIHTDYTDKRSFLDNMEQLINTLKNKTKFIVISQNTNVLPTPETMEKMIRKHGQVQMKEIKHNYQLTGIENKNSSRELLFILDLQN